MIKLYLVPSLAVPSTFLVERPYIPQYFWRAHFHRCQNITTDFFDGPSFFWSTLRRKTPPPYGRRTMYEIVCTLVIQWNKFVPGYRILLRPKAADGHAGHNIYNRGPLRPGRQFHILFLFYNLPGFNCGRVCITTINIINVVHTLRWFSSKPAVHLDQWCVHTGVDDWANDHLLFVAIFYYYQILLTILLVMKNEIILFTNIFCFQNFFHEWLALNC